MKYFGLGVTVLGNHCVYEYHIKCKYLCVCTQCAYRLTQMSWINFTFIVHQGVKGAGRHGEQVTGVSRVCAVEKKKRQQKGQSENHFPTFPQVVS